MVPGSGDMAETQTKDNFIPRLDNTTSGYKEWPNVFNYMPEEWPSKRGSLKLKSQCCPP
jgi:hypothetical protein